MRRRKETSRGQAMTEFALIAPLFFLLILGAFDFGLMMFTIGSARFASADAARVVSQAGNSPGRAACDTTCARLGLGQGTTGDCDADCLALVSINESPLLTSNLARILEVDIIQETVTGGVISDSNTRNRYLGNGQACSQYTVSYRNGSSRTYCAGSFTPYTPTNRNAIYGQSDTIKVDIVYEYDWKAGLMNTIFPQPPELHASYVVNIEPQGYR